MSEGVSVSRKREREETGDEGGEEAGRGAPRQSLAPGDEGEPLFEEMEGDEEEPAKALFTLFADKILADLQGSGTGDFVKSIMIMLPQSTASAEGGDGENPPLLTNIMEYCKSPNLNEPMATQGDLDETENEMRSKKKQAIGDLFDPSSTNGTNLSDMNLFYNANWVHMQRLILAEKQYSERLAGGSNVNARELLTSAGCAGMFEVVEEPLAGAANFQDLELGGKTIPGVQVDIAGLTYITEYSKHITGSALAKVLQNIIYTATRAATVSIKIGLTVIRMGVYGLILLSRHLYRMWVLKLGTFGYAVNYIMDKLWAHKELLFGGPFMDITNPSAESSYNRRMNRLVYIFLYAMIDLLKFIKKNRVEMSSILARFPHDAEQLVAFLNKKINKLSYREIFEHGPKLFAYIMGDRGPLKGRLSVFYDSYDRSIKFVTELLDARITQHLVNVRMMPRGKTNKVVIDSAPDIREANTEEMEEMRVAIYSYTNTSRDSELEKTICRKGYGDMMVAMREVDREVDALEPEPEGDAAAAQSKKKKTRKRRKSKGKNSTKGKKKKGKKKTKRGRKKK